MKFTEYGIRLREKQKVRRSYGLLENQFRQYFDRADRSKQVTGEAFLELLERRLDSVCYRLGFGWSRADARQLVRHKHVLVNGKSVNIPSFLIGPGDVVSVKEKSRVKQRVQSALEGTDRRGVPEWLELDRESVSGKVKALPNREELTLPIQEQLIVEFYSR